MLRDYHMNFFKCDIKSRNWSNLVQVRWPLCPFSHAEDHPHTDSLVLSLVVQLLLITIITQSATNEPGMGEVGGITEHWLERTVPYRHTVGLYRRNVGHPPAFPVCLTLNLAQGMKRGRGGGGGWGCQTNRNNRGKALIRGEADQLKSSKED